MTAAQHVKRRADAPAGLFACEAAGLDWLRCAGGAAVVAVDRACETELVLERLVPVHPSPGHAEIFGRALARTHAAGAPAFGAPPQGWAGDGFFGPLEHPLPLPADTSPTWGEFYARSRVDQVATLLRAAGSLSPELADGLGRLSARLRAGTWDDDLPPARLHGDLWSGNVVWTARGAVLIDPAAHGGHPVTDLAMLDLFGLPHLDAVLGAYEEVGVLPTGWPELIGLHQVYPVGMHAVLFGGGYHRQLAALVARYL